MKEKDSLKKLFNNMIDHINGVEDIQISDSVTSRAEEEKAHKQVDKEIQSYRDRFEKLKKVPL